MWCFMGADPPSDGLAFSMLSEASEHADRVVCSLYYLQKHTQSSAGLQIVSGTWWHGVGEYSLVS
jgi:hypothetical protein